jgi:catechol 2,3-dioxygenase-like lactoylglutathione lyase family enzyme
MITGMHTIIYSRDAEADRVFLRDVLGLRAIDAGGGWLIFAAPPAELAVHPDEVNGRHEIYLMCDDIAAEMDRLSGHGVECAPVTDEGWGLLTSLRLPGGGMLGLYEPHHASPLALRTSEGVV